MLNYRGGMNEALTVNLPFDLPPERVLEREEKRKKQLDKLTKVAALMKLILDTASKLETRGTNLSDCAIQILILYRDLRDPVRMGKIFYLPAGWQGTEWEFDTYEADVDDSAMKYYIYCLR